MPRLSDAMTEGTIVSWLKGVGESIDEGEALVEIETDKANMVFESHVAGVLAEIIADEGETLQVGQAIARIGSASDSEAPRPPAPSADAPPSGGDGSTEATGTDARSQTQRPASSERAERGKASPVARRMASLHGLELEGIEGSGPGGRVGKSDIERALAQDPMPTFGKPVDRVSEAVPTASTARGQVETVELSRTQQTVARRMAESKATAPHFYLSTEVDMTRCVEARENLKVPAEGRPRPSLNDLLIKACSLALGEHPRVNASYHDGRLEQYSRVNIGVAVAAPNALVVPTIFDADRKGVWEIAAEARQLAEKVRASRITPPEVSGGTFTVSNLGMYGVSSFQAVLNPPQAAILAVGECREAAVVRSGRIAIAWVMELTLCCDHRILYGADGAAFLRDVRTLLEEPLGLAM